MQRHRLHHYIAPASYTVKNTSQLVSSAIDNASNAIDYEHERKLADEQRHDTSAIAQAGYIATQP